MVLDVKAELIGLSRNSKESAILADFLIANFLSETAPLGIIFFYFARLNPIVWLCRSNFFIFFHN